MRPIRAFRDWAGPRLRRAPWAAPALLLATAGIALIAVDALRTVEAQDVTPPKPAPIDGPRAYGYLKQICAIGPRPAGSEANTRQREMVAKHFAATGAKVTEQPFTGRDPKSGRKVNMVNLVGSWFPDRRSRVVIGAHYDTRPFPDEDPDPAKRRATFVGANDGASGVALLMEIAHHLNDLKTGWGVDLVLFDGEELVYGSGPDGQVGEYFLGSKEFARRYTSGVDSGRLRHRYAAGIVLDMVADKDLAIEKEENSMVLAPGLVREVWAVARGLGVKAFRDQVGQAVLDDHLPLNNAGIPTIDLIDFDYPHWHTAADVPENCAPASLEAVGKVVTAWLAQPPRPRGR